MGVERHHDAWSRAGFVPTDHTHAPGTHCIGTHHTIFRIESIFPLFGFVRFNWTEQFLFLPLPARLDWPALQILYRQPRDRCQPAHFSYFDSESQISSIAQQVYVSEGLRS